MEHDVQSSMCTCVSMYDGFTLNYKCLPSCMCVCNQLLETFIRGNGHTAWILDGKFSISTSCTSASFMDDIK